jgi:hypothetical protein
MKMSMANKFEINILKKHLVINAISKCIGKELKTIYMNDFNSIRICHEQRNDIGIEDKEEYVLKDNRKLGTRSRLALRASGAIKRKYLTTASTGQRRLSRNLLKSWRRLRANSPLPVKRMLERLAIAREH